MKDTKYIEKIIITNTDKVLKNEENKCIIDIQDKKILKIDKKQIQHNLK
tara:strand:- start:2 stop:148 length:147 start_codon:yes stop_codon:yes gene_type:complete